MALSNETIQNKLIEKFGDQVLNFSTASGILSFESSKEINLKVLQYLYEEPSLGFTFLTDLCGVNYPNNIGAELVVVYHLHNFSENIRLRYSISTSVN
jgi:NADH-quinone oxidoreductase subunit C